MGSSHQMLLLIFRICSEGFLFLVFFFFFFYQFLAIISGKFFWKERREEGELIPFNFTFIEFRWNLFSLINWFLELNLHSLNVFPTHCPHVCSLVPATPALPFCVFMGRLNSNPQQSLLLKTVFIFVSLSKSLFTFCCLVAFDHFILLAHCVISTTHSRSSTHVFGLLIQFL